MKKRDKLKAIEEANKRVLGENHKLHPITQQYYQHVGDDKSADTSVMDKNLESPMEVSDPCKEIVKKIFDDFQLSDYYATDGNEFEIFYNEYFNQ